MNVVYVDKVHWVLELNITYPDIYCVISP